MKALLKCSKVWLSICLVLRLPECCKDGFCLILCGLSERFVCPVGAGGGRAPASPHAVQIYLSEPFKQANNNFFCLMCGLYLEATYWLNSNLFSTREVQVMLCFLLILCVCVFLWLSQSSSLGGREMMKPTILIHHCPNSLIFYWFFMKGNNWGRLQIVLMNEMQIWETTSRCPFYTVW